MEIRFVRPFEPDTGTLAVGVAAGGVLTAPAAAIDDRTDGLIGRILEANPRFEGKPEQSLALPLPTGLRASRLLLIGLGEPEKLDALVLQRLGGSLMTTFNRLGETQAAIHLDLPPGSPLDPAEAAAEFAFGARVGSYRFDRYRTEEPEEKKPSLRELAILLDKAEPARTAFEPLDRLADGVILTRDLVSEPANVLHPRSFAERCSHELEPLGVEVEILDEERLRDIGMGALLAVGQGSAFPSQVVVMRWNGLPAGSTAAPVAIIGKGVTFDTGGISIKPAGGMEDMKWDMGGAGAVTGLMKALAGRRARVHAVGLIGLVENMPSDRAQRPGDVVTSLSGKTIEVINTDAEGRLVLADVLTYAQDRCKPQVMIDLATLTGAVIVALGGKHAGLFANDDELARRLSEAGTAVGEEVWRLPLGESYDRDLDSDIADVRNVAGSRDAGAIIGAQFLQRFVGKVPWAHLDIAGVTWSKKDSPTSPRGGTGFGVRLLDRLIADHYESRA